MKNLIKYWLGWELRGEGGLRSSEELRKCEFPGVVQACNGLDNCFGSCRLSAELTIP